jgi:hypothetical protein
MHLVTLGGAITLAGAFFLLRFAKKGIHTLWGLAVSLLGLYFCAKGVDLL